MNGYQGDTTEHYRKTLFQDRPSSGPNPYNLQPQYSSRAAYPPSQQPSMAYSSGSVSNNAAYGSQPQPSHQQPAPQVKQHMGNGTSQNSWERKDANQLHPAIRQEYGNLFQGDYQPPPPRPSQLQYQPPSQPQYHSHVMQPPAMYDRQASQIQGYQPQQPSQPRQTTQQEHRPVHTSLSAAHPQSYNQASAARNTIQQPQQYQQVPPPRKTQPKASKQKAALAIPQPPSEYQAQQQQTQMPTQTTGNEHRAMFTPQQFNAKLQYQPSQQYQPSPQYQTSPHYQPSHSQQPQMQSQPLYQENESMYPHQQVGDTSQPQSAGQELHDFTDVPVDSTSIIEKLMQNLRKVPEQGR